MKKALLFILILICHCAFAQQWYYSTVPYLRDLNSVAILNHNAIIVAGGNLSNDSIQSIFESTTFGASWNFNSDTISSWIKSIAFADAVHGFGVGYNGKMVKTIDGGVTWQFASSPINRDFNKVVYINDSTLFVAGGRQGIISFQTILKSTDRGNTWAVAYDTTGPWLRAIAFVDALNGFAVGDTATLLSTNNGGISWAPVIAPVQRDLIGITFLNDTAGYIVGGNAGAGMRTILQTINAGSTWTVLKDETGGTLNDISFPDQNQGYIAGDSATVLKTIDGGQTWQIQVIPNSNTTQNFKAVKFYDDAFGAVVANGGGVYLFQNTSAAQVLTLGAQLLDTTRAILLGAINTYNFIGSYSFIYSTDSSFAVSGQSVIQNITCDSLNQVFDTITGLSPFTKYYFYLTGTSLAGTINGAVQSFYTGIEPGVFQTLTASQITLTSAQVNGLSGGTAIDSLQFEYGLTPAMGNVVNATPAAIADTQQHAISATITGLVPNSFYYYRLKGNTHGNLVYGQTLELYTGLNEIPNWDFQYWKNDTVLLPEGWNTLSDDFARVPGHSGNYALEIWGQNIALLGLIGDAGIFGGAPFNARPDSVTLYASYNIAAGDTAYMLVQTHIGGNNISQDYFPMTGNTQGSFVRLAYGLNYTSGLVPDSIIMGFVPYNIFANDTSTGNFLTIDDIAFPGVAATVPNPGFETWFDFNFDKLLDWTYPAFIEIDSNLPSGTIVRQAFFNPPSDYAAEIHNRINGTVDFGGQISTSDNLLDDKAPGFPITAKYQTLNGYYKFFPVNSDTMTITINVTSGGMGVGQGVLEQSDTVSDFTLFSIPIIYNGQPGVPDNATIRITPHLSITRGPSWMVIDKLSFDGFPFVSSDEADIIADKNETTLKVYPNPAKNKLVVEITEPLTNDGYIQLFDINGRIAMEVKLEREQNKIDVDVQNVPAGFYILNLRSGNVSANKKVVIIK